jgi:oligopeptidase A
MDQSNPLLDFSGLPRFDAIRATDVAPAIDALIASARAKIEAVATDARPATWDSVAEPIADALEPLDRAWGAVSHLNSVMSTPQLRDAYNAALPKVTAFYTELGQDLRLFDRHRALAASPGFKALDAAKRRLVANELRDFRLSGAELPDDRKARLKALREEIATLSAKFDDNLLDETNGWSLYVERDAELSGIPDDVLAEARAAAQADGRNGWKLTLRMPCYLPVMQYADDRMLRRAMHRGYATRASDLGLACSRDNTPLIARILELRRDAAQLLGFDNYAELSLVPKMAASPSEVLQFLRDLGTRAKPYAERDYDELRAFARDDLALETLEPWDIAYASEKLKAARYSFSEQEVRRYFPEDRVLAGLFGVVEMLYGVSIRESSAPTWHPTVRFFDIVREGALAGQFYLDLYARPGKQGGAWMDDAINRRRIGPRLQHPVAFVTCNLSAPVGGKPATFTHDEVLTIFHEFGHGLHLLLTQIDVAGVSGLQGVEWDAVELPSQFMENFCWQREVVRAMSAYTGDGASAWLGTGPRRGEPLPDALFDRMVAAKNFHSGLAMVRQLELALFDMRLHTEWDPGGGRSPQQLLDDVRREIAVVPRPAYDRFMQSFAHIFAGGYAAGYYSYKWAEVLSADAFGLFEETGVLSPTTGARFRDEVLARGGSRPAMESFVAFRGRAPQLDALLRHNGMTTA